MDVVNLLFLFFYISFPLCQYNNIILSSSSIFALYSYKKIERCKYNIKILVSLPVLVDSYHYFNDINASTQEAINNFYCE